MAIGRFAPSPTGPLHMGSLLTALASFADIRQRRGEWFVRIDDLDVHRSDAQAPAQILQTLQAHGLHSDRPVARQSDNAERYRNAFDALTREIFYCNCSRRQLAGQSVYPGTCRRHRKPRPDSAARLNVTKTKLALHDAVLGSHAFKPSDDFGDFIVKRRDGPWSYHLVTAVDDGLDVTHVLRGQDLWQVTPQQVYLMDLLNLSTPNYAHIPVLCFADGDKLSKQTHAPAIDNNNAGANLRYALKLLGQAPPAEDHWPASKWMEWAINNWQLERIPEVLAPYDPSHQAG